MNNKSIQILRGSETYDPSTSQEILLDGQPFYSKKTNDLYIGDGESTLSQLSALEKQFVEKKEINDLISALNIQNAYVNGWNHGGLYQRGTTYRGETLYDGSTYINANVNISARSGDLIPAAKSTGYQSVAFGGTRYDYIGYNYVALADKYYDIESAANKVKSLTYRNGTTVETYSTVNNNTQVTINSITYTISSNTDGTFTFTNGSNQYISIIASTLRSTTLAEGNQSFAYGGSAHAYGDWAFAGGKDTKAYQSSSFAIGGAARAGMTEDEFNEYYKTYGYTVNGKIYSSDKKDYAHSSGFNFAQGESTVATNWASVAMGAKSKATGGRSMAVNNATTASGNSAFAANYNTKAQGSNSFATGNGTLASGNASAAFGLGTKSTGAQSFVIGRYNASLTSNDLFVIGGGTSDTARDTVFSVDNTGKCISNSLKSGNCTLSGYLSVDGNLNGSRGIFSADVKADSISTHKINTTIQDNVYGSTFQPKIVASTKYKADGKLIQDQAAIISNKIYVRNYNNNKDEIETQTQITSDKISISGSETTTITSDKISTAYGYFQYISTPEIRTSSIVSRSNHEIVLTLYENDISAQIKAKVKEAYNNYRNGGTITPVKDPIIKSIKLKIIAGSDGFNGGIYLEREYAVTTMDMKIIGSVLPHGATNIDEYYWIKHLFGMIKNTFKLDFNRAGYDAVTIGSMSNESFKFFNESTTRSEMLKVYFYTYEIEDPYTSDQGAYVDQELI